MKDPDNGCVCGHGAYNHGAGWTVIGKLVGDHSRCISCDCMEFTPKDMKETT